MVFTLSLNIQKIRGIALEENQLLYGLAHLYNPETDTTSVSWAYKEHPDLDYFILEVYDEIKKEWVPFDNLMGIIKKDEPF